MQRFFSILFPLFGLVEALLATRLVLRLFAARPDNMAFGVLFALTEPFRAPFAALDAQQPRFGAVLELSTLAAMVALLALISVASLVARQLTRAGSGGI